MLPAVAIVATLGAFTGSAVATHTFPDVADTSPFHEEVGHIVGAGIATGFPDDTYRPTEPVNRQQMAAFLNRSGGRVGQTGGLVSDTAEWPAFEPFGSTVTMTVGGVAGTGFVLVVAGGEVTSSVNAQIEVRVRDTGSGSATSAPLLDVGAAPSSFSVTGVFPVEGGSSHPYRLEATADPDATLTFDFTLRAIYVPFSENGDATLG